MTMWLSIVGFSATIGWLNDKLAREQWAEEPANTFSRGMIRITQRAQQALQMEGRKGLRDELLNIPRMTRSHIYVVDDEDQELLGRDNALKQLVERRTVMDTVEFQDTAGNNYSIYTVNRTQPATLLAPGPLPGNAAGSTAQGKPQDCRRRPGDPGEQNHALAPG